MSKDIKKPTKEHIYKAVMKYFDELVKDYGDVLEKLSKR